MRLDVGVFRVKEPRGAIPGQVLDLIHVLAAAVVTSSGVPFCIFVCQSASDGLHDRRAGVVLAGDQL